MRASEWIELLDSTDREILRLFDISPEIYTSENYLVDAIKELGSEFVEIGANSLGRSFSRARISKIATILQMVVFENVGGPEEDRKPKALRRHWYQWYKGDFAQPYSLALGEDLSSSRWGLNWAGRLSQTYASLVDHSDVTYRDLWVEDASRMMEGFYEELVEGANIIIAVEKDSLFSDFVIPAKALGAKCVISGKGKSSKAATEKMLRDHFDWPGKYDWETGETTERITASSPLIVIHVSDHDYDGEAVIGPTFAEQCRRYTPYVVEARIGIKPFQLADAGHSIEDKMYQVKISNSAYETWAMEKGIFSFACDICGEKYISVGGEGIKCPSCGNSFPDPDPKTEPVYGLEVEAMTTMSYRSLIVKTVLDVMGWEVLLYQLRQEATADHFLAAQAIAERIAIKNESYQELTNELDRLNEIKEKFEQRIVNYFENAGEPKIGDFWEDGDDPDVDDFVDHVRGADEWSTPWRPFSRQRRTALLINDLEISCESIVDDFVSEEISW